MADVAVAPTYTERPFAAGIFRHDAATGLVRLIGTRCGRCEVFAFPARAVCAACGDRDAQETVELGPYGTLYTFAVVRQAPAPFVTPYAIGYVDLDEGARIFTHLEDFDQLAVCDRVELCVGPLYPGSDGEVVLTYKFKVASEAE